MEKGDLSFKRAFISALVQKVLDIKLFQSISIFEKT